MKRYQEYKPRKALPCWTCQTTINPGTVAVYIGKKINDIFATSKYEKPIGGKLITIACHKPCFENPGKYVSRGEISNYFKNKS